MGEYILTDKEYNVVVSSPYLTLDGSKAMTGNLTVSHSNNPSIYVTDTTNTVSVRIFADNDSGLIGTFTNHPLEITVNNSVKATFDSSGSLYIGDNANTKMTVGLTVNQGANDNEILAFKSSDVGHGITTTTETDTYAYMKKRSGGNGGLELASFTDTNAQVMFFNAVSGYDISNGATTQPYFYFMAQQKDGTGQTNPVSGATEQIFRINSGTNEMVILFGNGQLLIANDTVANANMGRGITINQAGLDNEILAFKSSDVGHSMITVTETDTYGFIKKTAGASGGLQIAGLTDTNAPGAIYFDGYIGHNTPTATNAVFLFRGRKYDAGTSAEALAATQELISCEAGSGDIWRLYADGDTWQNGTITAEGTIFTNSHFTIYNGSNQVDLLGTSPKFIIDIDPGAEVASSAFEVKIDNLSLVAVSTDAMYYYAQGSGSKYLGITTSESDVQPGFSIANNQNTWILYAVQNADQFGIYSADKGDSCMYIYGTGEVVFPHTSAFLAERVTSNQANMATGTLVTIQFNGQHFDQNDDFDHVSTYTFAAPVGGKYRLDANIRLEAVDIDADYMYICIVTSNRTYYHIIDPDAFDQDVPYYSMAFSVLADMDMADTAKVQYFQSSGAAQTDVGLASSTFSGNLVC